MAGITTRDEVVAALSSARVSTINKSTVANQATGGWSSLWRAAGTPAQAAVPSTAAICTGALTGSLDSGLPTPGAGQRSALLAATLASGSAGPLVQLVDRLAHVGGLSGTVTTAQTADVSVVSLAGTRCRADYTDVRWFIEIYTDIGTTAASATVSYTDSGGTSRSVVVSGVGGASPANRLGRLFPIIPDAATPLPIRSVETVQLSGSTGTAGSFGVVAMVNIASFGLPPVANYARDWDWAGVGAPTVPADACLALIQLCTTTSTGLLVGSATVGTG